MTKVPLAVLPGKNAQQTLCSGPLSRVAVHPGCRWWPWWLERALPGRLRDHRRLVVSRHSTLIHTVPARVAHVHADTAKRLALLAAALDRIETIPDRDDKRIYRAYRRCYFVKRSITRLKQSQAITSIVIWLGS